MKKQANWGAIIGVTAAMALVAGVGIWLALGHGEERVDTPVEEAVRELPDGLLATNEPLVQELYGQFEISPLQGFYADELLAEASDDNREHGRLEMTLNQAGNWTGAAVRAKYREMFGEDVELTEEKYGVATVQNAQFVATGMRFVIYNEEVDEFYELGPSMVVVGRHIRRLERAEKTGDRVYLYERALTLKCQLGFGTDEKGDQVDKEASCGVLTVAATCGTPEFGWSNSEEKMTDGEVLDEAKNKSMGLVRWVFGKNAEENYVFKGLERVMEGEEGEEIVETIEEREQKIKEANA